jgi:trigger factor
MSFSIENSSKLGRTMKISLPAEEIDKKASIELEKIKNQIKIDGFRAGKVPLAVVKQRFGEAARQRAAAELIESSYQDAIKSQNLRPAGLPQINAEPSSFGEPLNYIAKFEVLPEIQINEMNGVKIEKLSSAITDKEIDETILKMRKQSATWNETDRAVQPGDQLVIDFAGEIDGKFFDGGTAKDFRFEFGVGQMLPDFEDGLKNTKLGDEVTFAVSFPENYSDKNVAGKNASFKVKVHKVLEAKLAELNDDFFKKLGFGENGEEAFRAKIRKNLEISLNSKTDARFKKQMLDKLLELNPIEIPNIMVENEASKLQNQAKQWFSYRTKTPLEKVADIPLENFKNEARRRVTLGLLLAEIVKQYQLKIDDQQLRKKIESIASTYENPDQVVTWYYKDKKRLTEIESSALEDMVLEKLEAQLEVIPKNIDYNELVKIETEE